MHIILNILINIGIVILWLLGIILILLILVLFVPVRYKAAVSFDDNICDGCDETACADEEKNIISGYNIKARLVWLAGIVTYSIRIADGKESTKRLRILGIPVKKPSFGRRKRNKENRYNTEYSDECGDSSMTKEPQNDTVKTVDSADVTEDGGDNEQVAPAEQNKGRRKRREGKRKKRNTGRIKTGAGRIKNTLRKIKSILNNDAKPDVLRVLKNVIIKLLKHIRPKKIYVNMVIGTGDPCNTGMIFGGISIVMAMWPGRYRLMPDFYNKGITGRAYAKGRIRIVVLLYYIIKLMTDSNIKKLLKHKSGGKHR